MATQQTRPPDHWDDETKYQYRKHAGINSSQALIDELDSCKNILSGKIPAPPPYTRLLILKKVKAILFILIKIRGIDLQLARETYQWLLQEANKS